LSIANTGKFDLIITDLIMLGLDVAPVMETMKQRGDNTPVIAVTAVRAHPNKKLSHVPLSALRCIPAIF
jgi:CheY-like chemotaxis protein